MMMKSDEKKEKKSYYPVNESELTKNQFAASAIRWLGDVMSFHHPNEKKEAFNSH